MVLRRTRADETGYGTAWSEKTAAEPSEYTVQGKRSMVDPALWRVEAEAVW